MKFFRILAPMLSSCLLLAASSTGEAADVEPPTVEFTYPTDGAVLTTNWAAIRGVVVDEPGGSGVDRVDLLILAPDGTFWNGTSYGPDPAPLATVLTDGTNWARTAGIPIKGDLQMGDYIIFAAPVDLAGNRAEIAIRVTMNVPPPPGNDDFAAAALLAGSEGTVEGTTAGATRETGEPLHAATEGGASVWYRWTAPEPGFLGLNTLGSTFDSLLAVYTGSSISDLALVDANDDGGPSGASQLETSVVADTTYYIAIDAKFNAGGSLVLRWEFSSLARPMLRLRLTNNPPASLVLSWPLASEGFTLHSTTDLTGGWQPTPEQPILEGEDRIVVVDLTQGRRFFRLEKP